MTSVTLVSPEVGGAVIPEEFRRLYREALRSIGAHRLWDDRGADSRDLVPGRGCSAAPGLCGKPQVYLEIRIQDEEGRALPEGEVGEICVAPRWRAVSGRTVYTPMLGYWNKPEASAEALRDGGVR